MNIYYRYDIKKLCDASGAEIYSSNFYPHFPVQSSITIDWYFLQLNTSTNEMEAVNVSSVADWTLSIDNDLSSESNVMARAINTDIDSSDSANGHLRIVLNTNTEKFISVTDGHDTVTCYGQLKSLNNSAEKLDAFKFPVIADGDLDLSVDPPPEETANYYTKTEEQILLNAKENISNKVTSFQTTPDDTHYPSERLIKDSLDSKMTGNTPIAGATKTKITYDEKGLVTEGADATTADIADSNDRRYVSESEKILLANTSGTNSGNETAASIGALINNATSKTLPVDNDKVSIWDSVSTLLQAVSWSNIKAALETYFDTIYLALHAKADSATSADTATIANDLNVSGLSDESTPSSGMKLLIDNAGTRKKIDWNQLPGVSGGEANTASNVGTAGVGIFKEKIGVDLRFKKINGGSTSVTITDDTTNNEVDIDIVDASTSEKGKIECAEASEVTAGTSTSLAVTPDSLAGSTIFGVKGLQIQIVADTSDVDTTSGIAYFRIPQALNGMNLIRAISDVTTAGTTNATTIQVRNMTKYPSNDALSPAISVASGNTLGTAGTVDINYDDVSTNDLIKVYVTAQSITKPKGLRTVLEYQLP